MVPRPAFPDPKDLQSPREEKPLHLNIKSPARKREGQSAGKSSVLHIGSRTAAWYNLPSQETSKILSPGRQSQLPSFRVFLSVPEGKILL